MTAKSVLMRPQGLRPGARTLTCPPCYAAGLMFSIKRIVWNSDETGEVWDFVTLHPMAYTGKKEIAFRSTIV